MARAICGKRVLQMSAPDDEISGSSEHAGNKSPACQVGPWPVMPADSAVRCERIVISVGQATAGTDQQTHRRAFRLRHHGLCHT